MSNDADRPRSTTGGPRLALLGGIGVFAVLVAVVLRLETGLELDAMAEGLLFVGAGLAALVRWPESRTGVFLIAYAVFDWSIQLQRTHIPVLWTLAGPLFLCTFPALVAALVTFPTGRLRSTVERAIIAIAVANAVYQTMIQAFIDPAVMGCGVFGGADCTSDLNLLLVHGSPRAVNDLAQANPYLVSAFLLPTAVLIASRWWRATRPARRVLAPLTIAGLVWIVCNRVAGFTETMFFYLGRLDLLGPSRPRLLTVVDNIEEAAIVVLPLTFLLGLAGSRLRHVRVSRLVVELGELPSLSTLEAALRRALGDAGLQVGLWDISRGAYVGADGSEVVAPAGKSPVIATQLERGGRPLAVMLHDRALLDEPGLVEATAAATRLAVENERLQADLRAQLDEVRASRERIVAAQDEERRRIERDLHDGAQQRLLRLAMALEVAESSLGTENDAALRTSLEVAGEELQAALRELRELAQGIHPAVLTQRGLGAALRSLAETATVPVVVEAVPDLPVPVAVATAAFFVVSESLVNAAKHADASRVTVSARVLDGALELEVTDDGRGGADVVGGTGLRGLADRVEALGGALSVHSGADRGTVIAATIPMPT
jgi:signal transduction histidine kinase